VSVADLAIVAALIFGWGTLSARMERFDVTAPITFWLAGLPCPATGGHVAEHGSARRGRPWRPDAGPARSKAHPELTRSRVIPQVKDG
jgi:hypothetical protein